MDSLSTRLEKISAVASMVIVIGVILYGAYSIIKNSPRGEYCNRGCTQERVQDARLDSLESRL